MLNQQFVNTVQPDYTMIVTNFKQMPLPLRQCLANLAHYVVANFNEDHPADILTEFVMSFRPTMDGKKELALYPYQIHAQVCSAFGNMFNGFAPRSGRAFNVYVLGALKAICAEQKWRTIEMDPRIKQYIDHLMPTATRNQMLQFTTYMVETDLTMRELVQHQPEQIQIIANMMFGAGSYHSPTSTSRQSANDQAMAEMADIISKMTNVLAYKHIYVDDENDAIYFNAAVSMLHHYLLTILGPTVVNSKLLYVEQGVPAMCGHYFGEPQRKIEEFFKGLSPAELYQLFKYAEKLTDMSIENLTTSGTHSLSMVAMLFPDQDTELMAQVLITFRMFYSACIKQVTNYKHEKEMFDWLWAKRDEFYDVGHVFNEPELLELNPNTVPDAIAPSAFYAWLDTDLEAAFALTVDSVNAKLADVEWARENIHRDYVRQIISVTIPMGLGRFGIKLVDKVLPHYEAQGWNAKVTGDGDLYLEGHRTK